ncbi:MAG: UDP-N-acetylmuramoyl-tripeptide--D-alanyl-D-alanine ligase [Phycisphaerales bacterium]|nr:UDP-N-acetylmuramoyl-tripeptide--D-alanyl-D-alanine ligase [Phycisphaerales bacterium]
MSAAESFWSPEAIRVAAGGGRWLHRPVNSPAEPPSLAGLSTDSRTIGPRQVFLALCGDNFDGHAFLADALARGAAMAIIEKSPASLAMAPADSYVLLVDDTLKALSRLAASYRRSLKSTRFIGVTGSSGKTTTKQMLSAVLGEKFRVTSSPKSFNNHIGVPLTVLAAAPRDQCVICEIGTNHPGEIAALAAIVEPDIGVITGIGRVHLEGLGSIEGVANEKAALLQALAHGGWAAVNIDEPAILPHVENMQRGITFGFSTDADLRIAECSVGQDGTEFALNDRSRWNITLYGLHHASNATAAIAVGRRCGLADAQIQSGLLRLEPPDMRFTRHRLAQRVELFDDSYNANPDSMRASIRTFRSLAAASGGRTVVVLGDMFELGALSKQAHVQVAEEIADESQGLALPDLAVLVGTRMRGAFDWLGEHAPAVAAVHVEQIDAQSLGEIVQLIEPGDRVLVKGSRAMRLERVAAAIRERFSPLVPRPGAPARAGRL